LYPIGRRSESGTRAQDDPVPSKSMCIARPLLAVVTAALVVAPGASAASLVTETGCYQEGADVVTTGTGFVASGFVTVSLDGRNLGFAASSPEGIFRTKFDAPGLPAGKREQVHDLVATDATNTAITRFRATQVFAGFSPGAGNLGTLRVRFRVNGFGLYESGARVYVHYVRPNGKARRTVYLGKARGTCGHIRRTRKRLLFPFLAQRGVWTLQFDTRRVYGKATAQSRFAWVRRPVKVGR